MKIKCEYCETLYEDTATHCPSCGAPNPNQKQDRAPKTIDELREWYIARNLPPEEITRFFIGKDIKEARAFGIYIDEHGEFVVYKNKADGSRAVRYKGKDEAYAVNELYQKLKDEIVHQKNIASVRNTPAYRSSRKRRGGLLDLILYGNPIKTAIIGILIVATLMAIVKGIKGVHNGYYIYNNRTYYDYNGTWLVYNSPYDDYYDSYEHDWIVTEKPFAGDVYDDYFVSDEWNSEIASPNFEDSSYYEEHNSSSSSSSSSSWDSDSDYDWDSGSDWDSGGSDWDSDW